MAGEKQLVEKALNEGKGIFRLEPAWVPRSFCIPGRRLKLHPNDYYAYGANRGGIDERWFASTTKADNGPLTTPFEGLSFIHVDGSSKVLLKDALELAGDEILGGAIMKKYGGWMMYSKYFDNEEPLPHHIHHTDKMAANVGRTGKPEAYYFPKQLNNHGGYFPYTFFGLNPGTTKDELKKCLANWEKGDNGILFLSRAYKLKPGTGWDVPPGILHAPGSLLTYEPQRASDVFAMFQNIVWEAYTPKELLQKDIPDNKKADLDYYIELLDWELNTDPEFFEHRYMEPRPARPLAQMRAEGYEEYDIVYKSDFFSAKELTILPGKSALIKDEGPYGAILVQGHGMFGGLDVDSPAIVRFGEMTHDEVFVTAKAAREGVLIKNSSPTDELVMLKHFGPRA
jgi:hypothetical protein